MFTCSSSLDSVQDGFTALMVAAQNGHCEVVRMLLEAKADVNIKTNVSDVSYWLCLCTSSYFMSLVSLFPLHGLSVCLFVCLFVIYEPALGCHSSAFTAITQQVISFNNGIYFDVKASSSYKIKQKLRNLNLHVAYRHTTFIRVDLHNFFQVK